MTTTTPRRVDEIPVEIHTQLRARLRWAAFALLAIVLGCVSGWLSVTIGPYLDRIIVGIFAVVLTTVAIVAVVDFFRSP